MKTIINTLIANKEKIWVLTDQSLVSGVNFIVGILLARFVGLEQYGIFVLAWMVILFSSGIQQSFIIMSLYSLYPKQQNKSQYLSSLMAIQVSFSLIIFIIVYGIVHIAVIYFPEWNNVNFTIQIASIAALFTFNDYLRRLFFLLHKPKTSVLMDVITYGFQPIIILAIFYFDQLTLTKMFNIIIVLTLTSSIISIRFFYTNGISLKGIKTTLKTNWIYSKFLIGTSLLQWLSGNFFIVVAGGVLGSAAVGAIRLAQNIVGVLHVLFAAMENIIPVRAAELLNNTGKKAMLHYIGKIAKQAMLPTFGFLLVIVIFRKELITFFYGSDYIEFHLLLIAFCLLYVLVFIGTLVRFIIRTIENNKIIFISYIITTVFSLLFANIIVEHFLIMGVMIGLFSVQILTLSIYLFSLRHDLKWIFK